MADALSYAHTHNIIHRDIKLSNILIETTNKETRFVLVDFGVSRIAQGIQTVKHIAGTYHYMAPEQLRGRPCEQSDLWALGVCAYILLTTTKPFEGSTIEELSKKILLTTPEILNKTTVRIELELEKLIFKLLEKELTDRVSSAKEILKELDALSKTSPSKLIPSKKSDKRLVTQPGISTWEKEDIKKLRESWFFLVMALVLPNCHLSLLQITKELVLLGGIAVFYLGQIKYKHSQTISGIFVLFLGFLLGYVFNLFPATYKISILTQLLGFDPLADWKSFTLTAIAIKILRFVSLFIASHYFIKIKRIESNLVIYKVLKDSINNRKQLILSLKDFVDLNWTNINIRQKYIELLLLDEKFEEAIVEAKVSLEVDQYNFGLNLLLANGYFSAGLYEDCIQVCDTYLALSSYTFEFDDLKRRCIKYV
jgi:serine/threonine-protein kinase